MEAESNESNDSSESEVRFVVAHGVTVKGLEVIETPPNLGMLYTAVLKTLLKQIENGGSKWTHRRTPNSRWDLFLSEAQGQSIPWKKIGTPNVSKLGTFTDNIIFTKRGDHGRLASDGPTSTIGEFLEGL